MADWKPTAAVPLRGDQPRRAADLAATAAVKPAWGGRDPAADGKKLYVGRDISLSGEIAACDLLLVEGRIEGKLKDGRVIEVHEAGAFVGEALVDVAEISGLFEGTLTVRDRLVITPSGRVAGTIRYARIEIALGGVISGDVQVLPEPQPFYAEASRPAAPPQHEPEPEPAAEPATDGPALF